MPTEIPIRYGVVVDGIKATMTTGSLPELVKVMYLLEQRGYKCDVGSLVVITGGDRRLLTAEEFASGAIAAGPPSSWLEKDAYVEDGYVHVVDAKMTWFIRLCRWLGLCRIEDR